MITISGYDFVIGGVVPSRFGGLRLVDVGARAVEGPKSGSHLIKPRLRFQDFRWPVG